MGTSDHDVTRWRSLSSRWVVSSHRPGGGTTMVMPQKAPLVSWPSRPDTWNRGAEPMTHGADPDEAGSWWTMECTAEVAAAAREKCTALRCESVAPFG